MSLILDHVNHIYGEDTKLAVAALKDINLVIPDIEKPTLPYYEVLFY